MFASRIEGGFSTISCKFSRLLPLLYLLFLGGKIAGAEETRLYDFDSSYPDGQFPIGQLVYYHQRFFGATAEGLKQNGTGTIYTMTRAGLVKTLCEFRSSHHGFVPNAGPIQMQGNLYGTADGGALHKGLIFKMTLDGTLTILHNFTGANGENGQASDGAYPEGGLLAASDGYLYGVTPDGGPGQDGTVFRIAPDGSGYTILRSIHDSSGYSPRRRTALAECNNGLLYGTIYDTTDSTGLIYKLRKDGSGFAIVHTFTRDDPAGICPAGDLIKAPDGKLYGRCATGGEHSLGTVYRIDPDTDAVSIVWAFDGRTGADAYQPASPLQHRLLVGRDGNLYGVVPLDGLYGFGTLFQLTRSGNCTVIANFRDSDLQGVLNPPVQVGDSFYLTGRVVAQRRRGADRAMELSWWSPGQGRSSAFIHSIHMRRTIPLVGWRRFCPQPALWRSMALRLQGGARRRRHLQNQPGRRLQHCACLQSDKRPEPVPGIQ